MQPVGYTSTEQNGSDIAVYTAAQSSPQLPKVWMLRCLDELVTMQAGLGTQRYHSYRKVHGSTTRAQQKAQPSGHAVSKTVYA